MRSKEYWERRAAERTVNYHADAERTSNQIGKAYYNASKYIESEAAKVFKGFQGAFKISEDEAIRLLENAPDKSALQVLTEAAKKITDPQAKQEALAAISSPAYLWRINRLDELKKNITASCNELYKTELKTDKRFFAAEADKAYKNAIFDIQKGTGISGAFDVIPQSRIDQILKRNWSGENYSERIWKNTQAMADNLKQDMLVGMMTGKSESEMTAEIAQRYQVGHFEARRLVRTETTYVTNQAELEGYKELGVEQYEYSAVLDNRTSELCNALDGKKFAVKDAAPGSSCPPMHPFCRSTTLAVLPSEEELEKELDELCDEIGADVDFDEWVKGLEQGEDGKMRYVKPENKVENGVDKSGESGIIKAEVIKLKSSGMSEEDYAKYSGIINNHQNSSITRLYSRHADSISSVKMSSETAAYSPSSNSLTFNYNNFVKYPEMNKYGTLAHEYGHFFDAKVNYADLHFEEINAVQRATKLDGFFPSVASSSDEFLAAIRKDKEHIKSIFTSDVKTDLAAHNASVGVQDAIDGLFPKSRIKWGHGEAYYNNKWSALEFIDKRTGATKKKDLQEVYKALGFDVSNQVKAKEICRQYGAASEIWANTMSAEVCGGKELEYVKKYLPNSYQVMLKILKGAE